MTAGELVHAGGKVEVERFDDTFDFIGLVEGGVVVVFGGLEFGEDEVEHGFACAGDDVLLEIADGGAVQKPAAAFVEVARACDDVHQRGFARAVFAHQTDFVAVVDVEVQIVEEELVPEFDSRFMHAEEKGACHEKPAF